MDIFFLGDVHGQFDYLNWKIKDNPDVFNNSSIIQVGDFGIGFKYNESGEKISLKKLNDTCVKHNIHIYAIRGNHDNPSYFNQNHDPVYGNIHLVPDYSVLTIDGKNILCIGGAISIDRVYRIEGIDYWKDENFIFDEKKIDLLKNDFDRFDIVVTHSAPNLIYPYTNSKFFITRNDITLNNELTLERVKIAKLFEKVKRHGVKDWYYGHFHESNIERVEGVSFHLLNINEIKIL